MATIGTDVTLMDLARRLDSNDKIARIIEQLNKTNRVLDDMIVVEGNLMTGHKTTIRTGLPSVTWRLLNYGVAQSKSQTQQVTDTCGMLEAYAEVDKALADLNGNTAAFRFSEDKAFIEAMNQEMATTLFYGDVSADPEKFHGLAPRYATPSATETDIGFNMITGGGSGADNTSVWLIVWGDQTCHGIYPKGSKAGIMHEDLGQETLTDAAGGLYEGYRSHYKWDLGLTLRDWRYVVRICNLDTSALSTGSSAADLIDLMTVASEIIPEMNMGRPVFYCNRLVRTALRRQIRDKTNVNLTFDTVAGKRVLAFDEIPVQRCDALLNSEATISGTFATH